MPNPISQSKSRKNLGLAALEALGRLAGGWSADNPAVVLSDRPKDDKLLELNPKTPESILEDFVAMHLILSVGQCTAQLRNLAFFLSTGPLLLVLMMTSYPFQPQRFLLTCLTSVIVLIVGGVLWVYIQLDRDEFLSRVSHTPPNRVTLDGKFFTSSAAIAIPLIGLIVAQFPYLADTFNDWLAPVMRAFK